VRTFDEQPWGISASGSSRSDYWIDVVIESADGATQYDTTSAVVNDLAAGQSTTAKSLPITKDVPAGAILQVTTVQRTASN
jgi:hypothetical protein